MPGGLSLAHPPARIALVRMSAIGDTIHAVPLVASIRAAWPECRLTWVIQPVPHELMRGRPDVDEFLIFRRELGWRAFPEFRRRVRDRSFDLVIDAHAVFKAALVTRSLDAPIRLGYDRARTRDLAWLATTHRIPARPPRHVQDDHFELLEHLGVPVRAEWDFHFTGEERAARRAWVGGDDRPVLAMVPRSSRREKDWILERAARVLDVAGGDLGFRTVLVGGASAGELEDAARLVGACRVPPEVELRYDLRRLAWLLDASDLVVSPDTGPLHLAVALGTPTIGLYGFTDPARVGPYRRFGDLLIDRFTRPGDTRPSDGTRAGNMERIEVEDVIEKIELARTRYPMRGGRPR